MDNKKIVEIISKNLEVTKTVEILAPVIRDSCEIIIQSLTTGSKIILFGNGGSAGDAQHIAAELSGQFYNHDRPGLAAISLTSNTSAITAIGNDYNFSDIFSRQLDGLTKPGDVVLGISTSGNSKNVVYALEKAKDMGAHTLGLTGKGGGRIGEVADKCIMVNSTDTPRIQEQHILIGHIICEIVEKEIFS